MPWEIRQLLLGIHILLGIIWVGGILFVGWGVFPAARTMAYTEQRRFFLSLMCWTHWPFAAAGSGVIATGILLGTVAGPIRQWQDIWTTTYGQIWLTALLIALATLSWGTLVGYRQSVKVFSNRILWERAQNGNTGPLKKALTTIAAIEAVEVSGFIVLLACMLMLR